MLETDIFCEYAPSSGSLVAWIYRGGGSRSGEQDTNGDNPLGDDFC